MSSQELTCDEHEKNGVPMTKKMGLNLGAQKRQNDHGNPNGYAAGRGASIPIARPSEGRHPDRLMLVAPMNDPQHGLMTKSRAGHGD